MKLARGVMVALVAGAVLVGACGARRLDGSGGQPAGTNVDAHFDTTAQEPLRLLPDAVLLIDTGPGIPRADPDAGTCHQPAGDVPSLVCFGFDPEPYQLYLEPADGGPAPGQCPTMRDFMRVGGEICGYLACGPLLGSAVSELPDAGAVIREATNTCCFFVARLCGV